MTPASDEAVLSDLRYLATVRGAATSRRNLKSRHALTERILHAINVENITDDDIRSTIVDEALSSVATHARDLAIQRLSGAIWDEDRHFQTAAAAELLGITNDGHFAKVAAEYALNRGQTRTDQKMLDEHLRQDLHSLPPARQRQLRAAVWILKSDRTTRRKEVRDQLLQAFLDELTTLLVVNHEIRERLVKTVSLQSPPRSFAIKQTPVTHDYSSSVPELGQSPVPAQTTHTQAPRHLDINLQKALRHLAALMSNRLQSEQLWHHDNDPLLLPLRFDNADASLVDHWAKIRNTRNNQPIPLKGTIDDIEEVYDRVPSGRLIIFGKGGAGKTTLARALCLRLLQRRSSGHETVPIVFRLSSWAPDESLESWLLSELTKRYDYRKRDNQRAFVELLDAKLILPVFDGFDELPSFRRAEAIASINSFALRRNIPYIITSRVDEYREAIESWRYLDGAAGITIKDLELGDLREYLPYMRQKDATTNNPGWRPVLERLSVDGDTQAAMLLEVLSTPLMASIAAAVYRDSASSPQDLLTRFLNGRDIQDYLLDQYIAIAYKRAVPRKSKWSTERYNPEKARRWICYLAASTTSGRSEYISWWHFPAAEFSTWLPLGGAYATSLLLPLIIVIADGKLEDDSVAMNAASIILLWTVAIAISRASTPRKMTLRALAGSNRPSAIQWAIDGVVAAVILSYTSINLSSTPSILNDTGSESFTSVFVRFTVAALLTTPVILLVVIIIGRAKPGTALSPGSVLRDDRLATFFRGAIYGVWYFALLLAHSQLYDSEIESLWLTVVAFFAVVVTTFLSSASGLWFLWVVYASITGKSPILTMKFWQDAYDRGILRQEGGYYLFRHFHLQRRFTQSYLEQAKSSKPTLVSLSAEAALLLMSRGDLGINEVSQELRRIRDTPKVGYGAHVHGFRAEVWRLLITAFILCDKLDAATAECRLLRSSSYYKSVFTNKLRKRNIDRQYIHALSRQGELVQAKRECERLLKRMRFTPGVSRAERSSVELALRQLRDQVAAQESVVRETH